MTRSVIRRLLFLVVVMFGVSLLTFLIANVAPGDPARMAAGPNATPEAVAALRARERESFLTEEWPAITIRIRLLGLKLNDLGELA